MAFPAALFNRRPPLKAVLEEKAALQEEVSVLDDAKTINFYNSNLYYDAVLDITEPDTLMLENSSFQVMSLEYEASDGEDFAMAVGLYITSTPGADHLYLGPQEDNIEYSNPVNIATAPMILWVVLPPSTLGTPRELFFDAAGGASEVETTTIQVCDRFDFSQDPPVPTRVLETFLLKNNPANF